MSLSSKKSIHPLRLLGPYLRPYRLQSFLAFTSLTAAALIVLGFGRGLRHFIDQGLQPGDMHELGQLLFCLILGIMGLALASFGRVYYVNWLAERVTTNIRKDIFSHLLTLDTGFYEQMRAGDLISRLTNDTTLIQIVIGISAPIASRNFILFAGALIMMTITSLSLTLFSFILVPMIFIPIFTLGRRVRFFSKKSQERVADMGGYVEECINNIRTVHAFTHESIDRLIFKNYAESSFHTALQRNFSRALLSACVMILVIASICFVLWLGLKEVWNQTLTVGDLTAFIFYAVVAATSAGSFSEIMADLMRAAGAADRIKELLSVQSALFTQTVKRVLPSPSKGILAIHNISFAYPTHPERFVVDKFTLSIAPGENIAIVGPSGAGKSTIFSLLLRFYDPQSGSIYYDGVDTKEVDPTDLRQRIGLVSQDPMLFSTTLYENILYGRPSASEADVLRAANIVRLNDFLPQLPNGLQTLVGVRGVRLSGGQKQRIAIARAIVRDPRLLLLDEATSALDAESEQAVQMGLRHLMSTRTTLVIAHRLSTVLRADRIVVLDQGRIQAVGTHAELIAQEGLYRRLATLQFAEFSSAPYATQRDQ